MAKFLIYEEVRKIGEDKLGHVTHKIMLQGEEYYWVNWFYPKTSTERIKGTLIESVNEKLEENLEHGVHKWLTNRDSK